MQVKIHEAANPDRRVHIRSGGHPQKELKIKLPLHTIPQIPSLLQFEEIHLIQALTVDNRNSGEPAPSKQLSLFDYDQTRADHYYIFSK